MHRDLFKKHPRVSFRYDLLDCGIDICSYKSVQILRQLELRGYSQGLSRRSEVHNVEVGLLYYAHIVENNGYAARIRRSFVRGGSRCGVPE